MTEDEAYKVHIQHSFNAFCKIVIRHAAIDKILNLRRRWEHEGSLDYLMNEKFVQFAAWEPDEIFRYYFLRQSQREIGACMGRSRSTAGRHIQLGLQRLRRIMEKRSHE